MTDFFIGQIFEGGYPEEVAHWCNERQDCHVEKIGENIFKVVENETIPEKERIAKLNMTKLDFVKYLQQYGVTYSQLKELLATNKNAQMQWDLCERVYRFNPLLDELAKDFGITSEDLDTMFKIANGEV